MSNTKNFEVAFAELQENFDEPIHQALTGNLLQISCDLIMLYSENKSIVPDLELSGALFNLQKVIEFFKTIEKQ